MYRNLDFESIVSPESEDENLLTPEKALEKSKTTLDRFHRIYLPEMIKTYQKKKKIEERNILI